MESKGERNEVAAAASTDVTVDISDHGVEEVSVKIRTALTDIALHQYAIETAQQDVIRTKSEKEAADAAASDARGAVWRAEEALRVTSSDVAQQARKQLTEIIVQLQSGDESIPVEPLLSNEALQELITIARTAGTLSYTEEQAQQATERFAEMKAGEKVGVFGFRNGQGVHVVTLAHDSTVVLDSIKSDTSKVLRFSITDAKNQNTVSYVPESAIAVGEQAIMDRFTDILDEDDIRRLSSWNRHGGTFEVDVEKLILKMEAIVDMNALVEDGVIALPELVVEKVEVLESRALTALSDELASVASTSFQLGGRERDTVKSLIEVLLRSHGEEIRVILNDFYANTVDEYRAQLAMEVGGIFHSVRMVDEGSTKSDLYIKQKAGLLALDDYYRARKAKK